MKIVDQSFLDDVINFCLVSGHYSGAQAALRKLKLTDIPVSDGQALFTLSEAREIAAAFVAHGLPRSADILLEWIGKDVRSRNLTPDVVMAELQRSIERELRANIFLHVDGKRREYLEGKDLFGENVSAAFPSASYDIEEAGKCFALCRYTACVFHLMRVLEIGLDALKKITGLTAFSPTWKVALDQIAKSVTNKPEKDKTAEERSRDRFILDAVHYLQTVKDATRNPVVHTPARTYTEETALEVYVAMRAFVRHLSSRLSE